MMKKLFIILCLVYYSGQSFGQVLGVNIDPPISTLHIYQDVVDVGTGAGLTIEQDNATGDAVFESNRCVLRK